MSNHEGPGCGCSSCLEMYPTPEPCENCKRLERELAEARAVLDDADVEYDDPDIDAVTIIVDRAAWSRYQQEREGGEGR